MDIRFFTIACERCGNKHKIELDYDTFTEAQKKGIEPILNNYICPDIALMYRVLSFVLDTRVSIFKMDGLNEIKEQTKNELKKQWGNFEFDNKLNRFIGLDLSLIGIPEEYYNLLWEVVSSYCCGYYYPAITSAGALGERILNRLILKTRMHFKSSHYYKKVYNKYSFDNWDIPIKALNEWKIISNSVADQFQILKKYRNESIHYNDSYGFSTNCKPAIIALANIINHQFNYINRKDLFWVFNVPGEIWLRSNMVNDPFVIEFILPHCLQLSPYCEPMATPPIKGKNTPLKPLSDEEFIKIRCEKHNQK